MSSNGIDYNMMRRKFLLVNYTSRRLNIRVLGSDADGNHEGSDSESAVMRKDQSDVQT